jgi:O-antigen/teichoic acid export membrane protein
MIVPITIFSAFFAEDIILVLLGPKWGEAAEIFRLLTPAVLILGIISPLYWLLLSVGLQGRSLRIAMVLTPILTASYVIGLPYGPASVAFGYSAVMTLWLIPHVLWSLHGTVVSPKDVFLAVIRPVLGGLASVALAWAVLHGIGQLPSPTACRRRRDDDRLCGDPFIPVGTNEILFGSFPGIARSGSPARSLGQNR